jgi:hypothetical protein
MKKFKVFILLLPALNIIADFFFVFEYLRGYITNIRGLVLIIIMLVAIVHYGNKLWKLHNVFILMFVYFSILILFSSRLDISFPIYIKFFSSLIMFPVFYILTSSLKDIKVLKISYFITLLVFVFNFLLSDLLNLGRSVYDHDGEQEFYSGNFTASALYIGSLILIVAPIFYSLTQRKYRKILYLLLIISTVLILVLSMRRTALFIVVISYAIIGFSYRNKSKVLRYGLIVFVMGFVVLGMNFDKIQNRIAVRADRFEVGALEKEGRYQEAVLIFNNILSFKDLNYSFFGKELFNSAGNYNYPDPRRVIHGDYNIITSGSGIIGLGLYLLFNLQIFLIILKQKKKRRLSKFHDLFWVISLALLVTSIAASFSSGLFAVTYRITLFGLLGSFTAILSKNILPIKLKMTK